MSSWEEEGGERFRQEPELLPAYPSPRLLPSFRDDSFRQELLSLRWDELLGCSGLLEAAALLLPGSFFQELPPGIVSVRVMAAEMSYIDTKN